LTQAVRTVEIPNPNLIPNLILNLNLNPSLPPQDRRAKAGPPKSRFETASLSSMICANAGS